MMISKGLRYQTMFLAPLPNLAGPTFLEHRRMASCSLRELPLSPFAVSRLRDGGRGLANLVARQLVVQAASLVGVIVILSQLVVLGLGMRS